MGVSFNTSGLAYSGTTKLRLHSDGQIYTPSGSGGSVMGAYSYTQGNTGSAQNILGPSGGNYISEVTNNQYTEFIIVTLGTGTNNTYCHYRYDNNSDLNYYNLSFISGNSGPSSNRPYMQLSGANPQWNMDHSGSYTVSIFVKNVGSLIT